ncbi:MAG: hypothetical protein AB7K04_18015 [Pseudorhodoplanes sp.]
MTENPRLRVMMCADAEYRFLLLALARRLKQEARAEIDLYCFTPQESAFYRGKGEAGLFRSITDANILYPAARGEPPASEEVLRQAQSHERWLGLHYNELILGDRHFGRGFALGGARHPRSRLSEHADLTRILHAYNTAISFWRNQIEEKRPDLMLMGGTVPGTVARVMGIPYRTIGTARYLGYHYWAENLLFESKRLAAAYREIGARSVPARSIERPYDGHAKPRQDFIRDANTLGLVKQLAHLTARRAYWHLRRYEKRKGYYLTEELGYAVRKWRDARRLTGLAKLSDLSGKRFVFYPLQTEPEQSLQALSPEYFFQLETIAAIARDLPAGVLLVVKETFWSLGRRPVDFYDQIMGFKNVVMMDMLELGLDVVRAADVTLTITGTAGFEAAVMGKPVIAFGRHNLYNAIPHVSVIEHLSELKPTLSRLLDGGIDVEKAKADGQRFLEAVVATSFDLRGYNFLRPAEIEDVAIDSAYRSLIDSLTEAKNAAA